MRNMLLYRDIWILNANILLHKCAPGKTHTCLFTCPDLDDVMSQNELQQMFLNFKWWYFRSSLYYVKREIDELVPADSFQEVGLERHCVHPQTFLLASEPFFRPTIFLNSFSSSNKYVIAVLFTWDNRRWNKIHLKTGFSGFVKAGLDNLVVSIGSFSFNNDCFHTIWKNLSTLSCFYLSSNDVNIV